jgi:DNA repair exonuclease SbcCD ATPase subunit
VAQAAARAAYAAAIDKVEQLRLVHSAVREQQTRASSASRHLDDLKGQLERSREARADATTAIAATSDCRRVVIRDVEGSLQIIAEFREAAEQSLAAAAELPRRPDALADRLTESSRVFQRRHDKKREMTNVVSRLPDRSSECGRLMSGAQARIEAVASASLVVGSGARELEAEVDQLRRAAAAANARIASVSARGWLTANPGPVASAAPATRRLSEQAAALAGIEQLRLHDPSPDLLQQLLAYQDAALRPHWRGRSRNAGLPISACSAAPRNRT